MNKVLENMVCGEMAAEQNNLFRLFAGISGEMSVEDIPPAPGVDVELIKKGDTDPLEVVVEVPVGKSKRGWNYTHKSLQDIVSAVNTRTLAGFKGHQRPEDVSNQFLDPVTHWIGAKMTEKAAYFRGIVDQGAADLKRFIRAGRIKQVSIFGRPLLKNVSGETQVVGYDPLSIDWTPLDRMGMPTRIVAASGEMWDLDGEGPGEMKGDDEVDWAQVITEVKKKHGMKGFTIGTLAGEMGLTDEQVVAELTPEFAQQVQRALDVLGKAENILGVSGEMDVEELFKTLKAAADKEASASRDQIIGEMMESKVTSVAVRKDLTNPETPLGKMWSYHLRGIAADATKEQIAGEMDTFLADPVVKGIVDRYHTDPPAGAGRAGTGGGQAGGPQNLKTKRTSI
ncbi:hypothetical protein [Paenibacillus thiaminolyticus]|uniref:hypothetical protein n=1 Tax=Paenibacillus thiaminolyticus TaxID=49283 RepID=UPI002543DF38|nr:hypothetical protein [Paenibacillus thiaminolyticus]WII36827.1 hypothetical protein O0V01_24860 [Paenibacillus thiaminolyticus]